MKKVRGNTPGRTQGTMARGCSASWATEGLSQEGVQGWADKEHAGGACIPLPRGADNNKKDRKNGLNRTEVLFFPRTQELRTFQSWRRSVRSPGSTMPGPWLLPQGPKWLLLLQSYHCSYQEGRQSKSPWVHATPVLALPVCGIVLEERTHDTSTVHLPKLQSHDHTSRRQKLRNVAS